MFSEKISDMIISGLLKRGIIGDIKAFKTEVEIPQENAQSKPIKITITAENVEVRIDKEEK